jgi:hypothetical protein
MLTFMNAAIHGDRLWRCPAMTLARSILSALIGFALLAMPTTAAARDHQGFKVAYQEFESRDYPAYVCDQDGDDCGSIPWYGSDEDEDEDECEHDTFAQRSRFAPQYLNASVEGYYNG